MEKEKANQKKDVDVVDMVVDILLESEEAREFTKSLLEKAKEVEMTPELIDSLLALSSE